MTIRGSRDVNRGVIRFEEKQGWKVELARRLARDVYEPGMLQGVSKDRTAGVRRQENPRLCI